MNAWIPYRPFAVRIILRGVGMWVGLHGLYALAGAPGPLSWRAAFVLVLLASSLVYLDTKRCHELLFLGNCGVPGWSVAIMCAGPVVLLEILLKVSRGLWTLF